MAVPEERTSKPMKTRGGSRRINRRGIVEAAKALDPEAITMQAVADELGVDRTALNYHVSSRDGLLQLVAADAFLTAMTGIPIDPSATWQEVVVAFARGTRDGMAATGALSNYFRIDPDLGVLEPAELTFEKLVDAGLSGKDALGVLQHVTIVALGLGRDLILQAPTGTHPQIPEVLSALGEEPQEGDQYTQFRSLVRSGPASFGEEQFLFEMRLVVGGIASLLADIDD